MASERRFAGNMLLLLVSLIVGIAVAEAAAQFYAYKIAMRGKMFQPDDTLGWKVLPNLDLTRKNHDGDLWRIVTDDRGIRGPSTWSENAARRMLILGDSFAFGEGVDIEDRFDTLIAEKLPDMSVINLGVMGYGTDQQAIELRSWADQLRQGDVLLLLTYSNDFFDIASTTHSGRSKPWFELQDDALVEHSPSIGLLEIVRDRSYLLARLAAVINVNDQERYQAKLKTSGQLYEKIVTDQLAPLMERGVDVVIVHHGDDVFDLPFDVDAVFERTCRQVTSCLALDPATAQYPKNEIFISDGHWAEDGHRVAAEQIVGHLSDLLATKTVLDAGG